MTSFTVSKNDVLMSIVNELNLSLETFWTHEELLGHVEMAGLSYDVCPNTADDGSAITNEYVYHFGGAKGAQREIFNDVLILVNYDTKTARALCVSRPLLGYVKPNDNDILVKWPVRDGTVFRLIHVFGRWMMVSKNAIDISERSYFTMSFSDIFKRLVGSKQFDTKKSYVISMTSTENCLYKDTVDSYAILEEVSETDDDFVVILNEDILGGSVDFGYVYRTIGGFYIDSNKKYREISRTLYNVNSAKIRSIIKATGPDTMCVRKYYIAFKAILTGHDSGFCNDYPSLKQHYQAARTYITNVCRIIFAQCSANTKNPKYNDTFIGCTAEKIGSLKTSHGLNVVKDVVQDVKNLEALVIEFIKFNEK